VTRLGQPSFRGKLRYSAGGVRRSEPSALLRSLFCV
jgi:hypothetical protein